MTNIFSDVVRTIDMLNTYVGNLEYLFLQESNQGIEGLAKTKQLGSELRELVPRARFGNISYSSKRHVLIHLDRFLSKLVKNLDIPLIQPELNPAAQKVWDIYRYHMHTKDYYSSYLDRIVDELVSVSNLPNMSITAANLELNNHQIVVSFGWRNQEAEQVDIVAYGDERFFIFKYGNTNDLTNQLKTNTNLLYLQAYSRWGNNRFIYHDYDPEKLLFSTKLFLNHSNMDESQLRPTTFAEVNMANTIDEYILRMYLPHYVSKSSQFESSLKETILEVSTYAPPKLFTNVDYISQLNKFLHALIDFREWLVTNL